MHDGQPGDDEYQIHIGDKGKAILTKIHKGGTIGLHPPPISDDVNFVLSGRGTAICDERKNSLLPDAAMSVQGVYHIALPTLGMRISS